MSTACKHGLNDWSLLSHFLMSGGANKPLTCCWTRHEKKTESVLVIKLMMKATSAVQCTELKSLKDKAVMATCATMAAYTPVRVCSETD